MDTLTTNQLIVIAAAIVLVAAAIAVFASRRSRQRHAGLKDRFGPEYDREVEKHGNVARAERELIARQKRVEERHLKPLAEADRARFSADWRVVQARFVDDPSSAVSAAHDLIKAVMLARGYDIEDYDTRVADLSVGHANVVQHYRAARGLADANREGRANTEELRQAVVHYRALFADLLEQPTPVNGRLQEARA
ncbi:MAG: hypothetical protein RL701_6803 [Pseudomonadota bacterium]